MRTIETKIYTFDELSESAKAKALDRCRYFQVECFEWWEGVFTDAETIGLRITSFELDRGRHACGIFVDDAETVARAIMREHGPDCETHKDAAAYLKSLAALPLDEDGEFDPDAKDDLDDEFLAAI